MLAGRLLRRIHLPGPGLPPLPPPPRGDGACRTALEQLLLETIIPAWLPTAIDREHGGYHLNHDGRGRSRGPGRRRLVTQARTLWFFSELAASPYGREEHLEAARHGFRYLRDVMQDPRTGGYWWEVGPSGRVTNSEKHLCGHSFALYALSAFARASAEAEPAEMARALFDRIEAHHDPVHGGYDEAFDAEWRPRTPGTNSALNTPAGLRTLNTHLHLLEAFAEYARLTGDSRALERTRELAGIFARHFWRGPGLGCTDRFTADWEPVPGPRGFPVSYGHDLEGAWLLLDAADVTGDAESTLPVAAAMAADALERGLDRGSGGVYDGGPSGEPPDRRARTWWVQAEALNATLELSLRTGDPRFRDAFEETLGWITHRQVDGVHGGWHETVLPDGRVRGPKAGPWKCPYHEGRAVLRCLRMLTPLD